MGVRRHPVFIQPPSVPVDGHLEDLLHRGNVPNRLVVLFQPGRELGFRPEPVNVPSGESDVVPELTSRNRDVNHRIRTHRAVSDAPHQLSFVVRRDSFAVAHQRQDAKGIPGTVGVPGAVPDYHLLTGPDTREWMGHPDLVLLRDQDNPMFRCESVEGLGHLVGGPSSFRRDLRHRWPLGARDHMAVDLDPHLAIERSHAPKATGVQARLEPPRRQPS